VLSQVKETVECCKSENGCCQQPATKPSTTSTAPAETCNGSTADKIVNTNNCDMLEEYAHGVGRNGMNHCRICANSMKIIGDFMENNHGHIVCTSNGHG